MTHSALTTYCLSKKGACETLPFDDKTLVYKVGGRIFAITSASSLPPLTVSLKCEPDLSLQLREEFKDIVPGYHLNKQHWNTVRIDGELSEQKVKWLIDMSYMLVFNSLSKKHGIRYHKHACICSIADAEPS